MANFEGLNQKTLNDSVVQAKACASAGKLPTYIPQLAIADPTCFAVQICQNNGATFASGQTNCVFPLMSVVKPLMLLYLLETLGEAQVFTRVGKQPSEQPFNSLTQLQADQGKPRNPMINSGAIALADLLPGNTAAERCKNLGHWLNQHSTSQWQLDSSMLESVRSLPNPVNQAIAELLHQSGFVDDAELALNTYQQVCCLSGTVSDLALSGLLLARSALPSHRELPHISPVHQRMLNALMLTCGLYEASSEYAVRIGLPIKSGVSGALLAVVPSWGAIACYSPPLNETGNSIAGLWLIEHLAQMLELSLFG